jgi:hypothetical protein
MSSNLHRNSTEANKHTPKGFDLAVNNSRLIRDERGQSRYVDNLVQERAENLVNGNSAPPTTTEGHVYVLIDNGSGAVNAGWQGAEYNDVVRIQGGVWSAITPVSGYLILNKTDGKYYKFNGSIWEEFGGSVVWGNITGTLSDQTDLNSALGGKEPTITAGTTGQYYRGDKTFQTLDKTAVGLSNVDNTSDVNKPVSTAQQTEINTKNIFAYDDTDLSPLTRRTKYRAVEYIEFEDDAINSETKIQLRADSVTPSEVTRFGENGSGNVDLKIQENKLLTGTAGGFAIEYTASAECIIGLDSDSEIKEFEVVEIYNILKEETITANKTLALLDINGNSANVKAKFEISAIAVQNTTANAVTISIGSTALGTDVANAVVIGANATLKLPLGTTFFSTTTGQNLFISSALWNSSSINIHVTISKIWQ